ncbi:hypothetical protein D3C71_1393230 [compost metagenome]
MKVITPPVTVLPEYGSLTESSLILSTSGEGRQVSVADSHIERSMSPWNFSGLPKIGDCAARLRHSAQSLSGPGVSRGRCSTGTVSMSP